MSNFIKNFVGNFKSFVQRIFNNKTLLLSDKTDNYDKDQIYTKNETNIIDELSLENKKNQTMNEIIELIETQPKVLYKLNSKQLNIVENYYNEENEKLQNEINEKKKKIKYAKDLLERLNLQKSYLDVNE